MSARVAVLAKDGHLLEFDLLMTSPSALDELEGITESAKKQAKKDMAKLIQAAVVKWTLGHDNSSCIITIHRSDKAV
jgi:hypothetical protein